MNYDAHKIREAFLEHYDIGHWVQPVAVTLTLRKAISSPGGLEYGSPEHYRQNLRHALNIINRQLYGRRWREKSLRIQVIPVLEQDQSGRHHYHLAVDLSQVADLETFSVLMSIAWHKSDWGYDRIDVRSADSGWLRYMLKRRGKADYASSIDWDNLYYYSGHSSRVI